MEITVYIKGRKCITDHNFHSLNMSLGRLDLPVYTEGRAAHHRRSACYLAVPRTYYAVIPEETNTATWETGNIGVTRVAREGKWKTLGSAASFLTASWTSKKQPAAVSNS